MARFRNEIEASRVTSGRSKSAIRAYLRFRAEIKARSHVRNRTELNTEHVHNCKLAVSSVQSVQFYRGMWTGLKLRHARNGSYSILERIQYLNRFVQRFRVFQLSVWLNNASA